MTVNVVFEPWLTDLEDGEMVPFGPGEVPTVYVLVAQMLPFHVVFVAQLAVIAGVCASKRALLYK